MPLINKYGRRPIYIISFSVYFGVALWGGLANSFGSEMGARVMIGLTAGAGECLAPLTIADIWFLHERGQIMAYISCQSILTSGYTHVFSRWVWQVESFSMD